MKKKFSMKPVLVLTIVASAMALTSLPALAATGPAPGTGLVGACNMLVPAAASGMFDKAMSLDNANGNAGMFHAADVSGCVV